MSSIKRFKSCHETADSIAAVPISSISESFLGIEFDLSEKIKNLKFESPVEYVYHPLEYARDLHVEFTKKYYDSPGEKILFLGMNPGPWGMCQTGIPFGEIQIVKEWFNISGEVGHPEREHSSRKILGLNCMRIEGSGRRFWRLMQRISITPEKFFKYCIVYNLCPAAFLTKSGRNVTPVELQKKDREILLQICNEAFVKIVTMLNIKTVVGIGKFAEQTARRTLRHEDIKVSWIPHPSRRNRKYGSNWEIETEKKLQELGIIDLLTQ